jgi:hypothetical protein
VRIEFDPRWHDPNSPTPKYAGQVRHPGQVREWIALLVVSSAFSTACGGAGNGSTQPPNATTTVSVATQIPTLGPVTGTNQGGNTCAPSSASWFFAESQDVRVTVIAAGPSEFDIVIRSQLGNEIGRTHGAINARLIGQEIDIAVSSTLVGSVHLTIGGRTTGSCFIQMRQE